MASQFALLGKKRFLPMFLTQFLGAFNDNLFKQALILMLTYEGAKQLGMDISLLNNLAVLMLILPFFLFSSTAGQIADKYEKSGLTRNIKVLELVISLLAAIGFVFKIYPLLFLALFLLGTQSTFFGPVKYAYLPQALHKDELVGGNGLFQTGTSLAIVTSMIAAGVLVKTGAHYTWWLSLAIVLIALFGYLASRGVPEVKATNPQLNINWNIFSTSISTVAYVKQFTALFFCLVGVSWYWFYGATVLTQIAEVTKSLLNGDEAVVIFLLTLFSVGIAIGSLLCKVLTKGEVSLKLLPIGLAGLTIFTVDLYLSLNAVTAHATTQSTLVGVTEILSDSTYWRVFADYAMLGLFGGFYIVPLYAFMQAYAPASHRARVIAANNIMNAFFMVISAIFAIVVLSVLKLSLPTLFLITAVLNVIVGFIVWKMMTANVHKLERQDTTHI